MVAFSSISASLFGRLITFAFHFTGSTICACAFQDENKSARVAKIFTDKFFIASKIVQFNSN
jgi:hypothetical protein